MSDVPVVPDSDRRSTATLSASTGPVTVGFAVYGGAADLSVFVDGVLIDPSAWVLTSASALNVLTDVLPAGDGRVTFNSPQTGSVAVIGEIKPKRLSQFTVGVGITAESHNLVLSTIIACLREVYSWGKAALKLAPGERSKPLPDAATRAGKVLSFDSSGDPETTVTMADISQASADAASAAASALAAETAESNVAAILATADFTFYGSGVPSNGFGSDGDVYVNTAHARWSVYGPKAAGAWGSIVGYMLGADGTGNVNASSNFGTDNRILRSDGTLTNVQSSGVTISDSDIISGGSFANTALKVRDTDSSHSLGIVPGSNITADRTLTITTGDADRTLTISGNTTLNGPASTTNAGPIEIATSAEYRTKTDVDRALGVAETWGAADEVTLTDAATIAVDMATFLNATVTLAGNRALGNPTNESKKQSGYIRIVQDATGSRTLSYGTDWEFAGGSAPTLSTAANAQDMLFYQVIASDRILGTLVKAIA